MSKIIYPSSNCHYGPWLLDLQQLQQLDEIVNVQWEKLSVYRNNRIIQEIERNCNNYPEERRKSIRDGIVERVKNSYENRNFYKILSINYKSGRKLEVESFKEAAMHKEFENDMPLKFTYKINCVDIEAEIKTSSYLTNQIEYSVNTCSIPEAQELFYELEGWLKRVKPSFLVKSWSVFGAWLLILTLILLGVHFISPFNNNTKKDTLIQEAHKILNDGISNDEISKVLEILLSLETKYNFNLGEVESKEINYSKLSIFLAISLCVLILSFPPKSIIGIGKGEKKLNIWRNWIKVVTYIIPVLVILPIIINKLSNIL